MVSPACAIIDRMSISRLPSGAWRAQIHDPRRGGNIGVGHLLGGPSTFPTREDAEAARARARAELCGDPVVIQSKREAREQREAERLAARMEDARQKRAAITAKLERWLSEGYLIDATTGCWVWQGTKDGGGYGRVSREGRGGGRQLAHRWFFDRLVGPIPETQHLDHLCRNRACVNPEHLEPVTPAENIRRAFDPPLSADELRT